MKTLSVASTTFAAIIMLSVAAQAATVVTGGRCTEKQKSNKLTTCETSEFTNSAGQTGYKCTCTDKLVRQNPVGAEPGVTAVDPTVSPAGPEAAPAPMKPVPHN